MRNTSESKGSKLLNQMPGGLAWFPSESLHAFISGAGSGVICTCLCAPLDVAKVRIQVQGQIGTNKYNGFVDTFRLIMREEGTRGFYKGLGPALCTVPLFWGIYWSSYERLKVHFAEKFPESQSWVQQTGAAICSGAVGDVVTNPFWVVRTRIQTLILHKNSRLPSDISMVEMFRHIYQNEGFSAFYRGLGASFLGLTHVAIQFPLYEYAKKKFRDSHTGSSKKEETALELMAASVVAKITASAVSYPHEVLRSRLQDIGDVAGKQKKRSLLRVFYRIVAEEGVSKLWSGITFNLFRVIPATVSTFLAYEYISRCLKG